MITVVIPALDEAGAIAATIATLAETLAGAGYTDAEILVIDDGSSDGTGDLARAAGATVIRHPHNVGYGRSLKDGIRNARHDAIVIIDADLTYPVAAIPMLAARYREGYDMVVGARTGHSYEGGVFKGPLRTVLRWLVEFTAGREIPDANSGLRIFGKATVSEYLDHLCDTFSFTTSLGLAYAMTGKFVCYLPIEYYERVGGSKVRLFRDSLRTMQYIVQSILYYNPLKIFILLSGVAVMLALGGFLTAALTGIAAPYYLGIGSLLMSMLIFGLGLIADLLRQIMRK